MNSIVDLLGGEQAVEQIVLPAASSIAHSIGRHHTIQSAIADLVDNSIDGGASIVLVRFLQQNGVIVGVQIVDNGKGMTFEELKDAMTLGKRRDYGHGQLGHFGMGLKASSLSQANVLSVWSRGKGDIAVGLRLTKDALSKDSSYDVLSQVSAQAHLYTSEYGFEIDTGTVVQWSDVYALSAAADLKDQTRWFEDKLVEVRQELGIVFHRLLQANRIEIRVDVYDVGRDQSGLTYKVEPVDPFEYKNTGLIGYPRKLEGQVEGGPMFTLLCHLLPPGSETGSARLLGKPRVDHQGIYVYRNDRLLQIGGWGTLLSSEPQLQLARVAMDIDDGLEQYVVINSEKQGVKFNPSFARAIDNAVDPHHGVNFRGYLAEARNTLKASNKRERSRRKYAPMGKGFAPSRKRFLANEKLTREGSEPVSIRWKPMTLGFFEIDLPERTIYLNQQYRQHLNGGQGGSMNDSQLVKTLMFLLLEEYFEKSSLHSNTKTDLNIWSWAVEEAVEDDIEMAEKVSATGSADE